MCWFTFIEVVYLNCCGCAWLFSVGWGADVNRTQFIVEILCLHVKAIWAKFSWTTCPGWINTFKTLHIWIIRTVGFEYVNCSCLQEGTDKWIDGYAKSWGRKGRWINSASFRILCFDLFTKHAEVWRWIIWTKCHYHLNTWPDNIKVHFHLIHWKIEVRNLFILCPVYSLYLS